MTPTICLMLKAPQLGRVKTRLAAGIGADAALAAYRWLGSRQLAAVPRDWRVEVHFDPPEAEVAMRAWLGDRPIYVPQVNGGLTPRLTAATAGAFARGAEAVFLVGGDCPSLDAMVLRQAAESLEAHDAVLGPAADGGYYLLGLTCPVVSVFTDIPWSTAAVAETTRAHLREAGLLWGELPTLSDIDEPADWTTWAAQVK